MLTRWVFYFKNQRKLVFKHLCLMIYLFFLSSPFFLSAFASLVEAGLTTAQEYLFHWFSQRVLHSVSHSPFEMRTTPEVTSIVIKIRSANRDTWGKKLTFRSTFDIQHCLLLVDLDALCFNICCRPSLYLYYILLNPSKHYFLHDLQSLTRKANQPVG